MSQQVLVLSLDNCQVEVNLVAPRRALTEVTFEWPLLNRFLRHILIHVHF